LVLDAARRAKAHTLDVTGGAPEMHPHFRSFVSAAVAQGLHVIVRTNLTILGVPGYRDLPAFYAEQGIHLVASLPCYLETNVEKQRGKHVLGHSVDALRRLNEVGYGENPRLELDLVYNPGGASLPPAQDALEDAYRIELDRRFGIRFNRLLTITNMPIGRFQEDLEKAGEAAAYEWLLDASFNPSTIDGLMCRHQVHVGWDGTLYDCDFNFALGLPASGSPGHVRDFNPVAFRQRSVQTGPHCFGCTAGCGSSCKGSLV
ncbi:MAG: arsenosugar biosynthesis radical SAM (seleno)protein ArsS, partial [Planctomycetota bacterium]